MMKPARTLLEEDLIAKLKLSEEEAGALKKNLFPSRIVPQHEVGQKPRFQNDQQLVAYGMQYPDKLNHDERARAAKVLSECFPWVKETIESLQLMIRDLREETVIRCVREGRDREAAVYLAKADAYEQAIQLLLRNMGRVY